MTPDLYFISGLTPNLYFFWARGPRICKYNFTGDPESANKGAYVTPILDIIARGPPFCIYGLGYGPQSVVLPKKNSG